MSRSKYVVISPVRNEGRNLPKTIQSMAAQTLQPAQWIVVNDGSTDKTRELVVEAARQHAWITLVDRPDRGHRKSGAGVVEAFYDGFRQIVAPDWDYIVKFDGDLEFGPDYFRQALEILSAQPKLGITGGDICHWENGDLVLESKKDPAFHVRGATKIYRRACWEAIGGILSVAGWDTLDEVKANMLGWETRRIPELKLIHLRFTGSADGTWKNALKNGRGSYICGYHPLFLFAKCAKRFFKRPMGVESLGLLVGYVGGCLGSAKRVHDRDLVRYLRSQQLRLLLGKPSLWDRTSANAS
ncbi:MAG: glycosyltransferase family 2 protein [Verrucomicrobia bacterium]|nr:glycosyltransferase family 2 protein [Verrucomicrobiota bacterium]